MRTSSSLWRLKGYSPAKSPLFLLCGDEASDPSSDFSSCPGSFSTYSQWEGPRKRPGLRVSGPARSPWRGSQAGRSAAGAPRLRSHLFHMGTFLPTLVFLTASASGLSLGCDRQPCHSNSFWVLGLSQGIVQCIIYVCDPFDRWHLITPLWRKAKHSIDLQV